MSLIIYLYMSSNHHLLTNEAHRIPKCNIPGLYILCITLFTVYCNEPTKRQPVFIDGDSGVGVVWCRGCDGVEGS